MKRIIPLLMLILSPALYGQSTDRAEELGTLTGLEADNYLVQGFAATDRASFLPELYRGMGDNRMDIPLRRGVSALSAPTLISLLDSAGLREENRVLIVGEEGSYCATALSRAGMEIYLIDPTAEASPAYSLKKDMNNLNSWIAMAPFDFILCLNPREAVPNQLLRQLSARGILVTPLAAEDYTQSWFRAESDGGELILSMLGTASIFPLF